MNKLNTTLTPGRVGKHQLAWEEARRIVWSVGLALKGLNLIDHVGRQSQQGEVSLHSFARYQ